MERHGYKKTPVIYNAFLKCAKENMELERAIDILDEMKKCSIKPSMSSYSELIDLAVTFEEPEIAYELLLSAKLLKDFAEYEEPLYLNVLRSASYHYKV
jgi:pentatricopeptide repeat protein